MKKIELMVLAVLCMATVLVSCSGEDGEQGPEGPAGIDGVDGIDGNANVQALSVDVSDWEGGPTMIFNIPDNIDKNKYAFLFYLESLNGEYIFPVPGASIDGSFNTTLFYSPIQENGTFDAQISFINTTDGTPFDMPTNFFGRVIIIAAEIGTASKNGSADLLSELKAAGVDISDYHAVSNYFGLE
jgi:hypothetical protein